MKKKKQKTFNLLKRVIVSADDFGLSEAINAGIERAHRNGILTSASLMVGAPAAADAVRRARAMPNLRVGLHLVVIEGDAVLASELTDRQRRFGSDQLRLGLAFCRHPRALAAEIRAQFAAYAATGLALDHADAHKHMHLHPVVGTLLTRIGQEFGLRAVRVPAEPPAILAACGTPPTLGARALHAWTGLLRRQVRRAGMRATAAVFGLAWSGHMTEQALLRLIPHLPEGTSEIYFHPAASRDAAIASLMPTYEHTAELAALTSPRLRESLLRHAVTACTYADLP